MKLVHNYSRSSQIHTKKHKIIFLKMTMFGMMSWTRTLHYIGINKTNPSKQAATNDGPSAKEMNPFPANQRSRDIWARVWRGLWRFWPAHSPPDTPDNPTEHGETHSRKRVFVCAGCSFDSSARASEPYVKYAGFAQPTTEIPGRAPIVSCR